MSKDIELPKLNSYQAKKIMEHLKNNKGVDKKRDMDEVAQDIVEVLMLYGFSNGEASYVLLNAQRHLLSLEKNKESLEKLGVEVDQLDLDSLVFIMGVHAKNYRDSVDDNGKPKH